MTLARDMCCSRASVSLSSLLATAPPNALPADASLMAHGLAGDIPAGAIPDGAIPHGRHLRWRARRSYGGQPIANLVFRLYA